MPVEKKVGEERKGPAEQGSSWEQIPPERQGREVLGALRARRQVIWGRSRTG